GHQRFAAITATAGAATVHGLGGIGKTRAAIEYAYRHADEFTALLFVRADSPSSLQQNLAALCGPLVLDLAEKEARETEVEVAAVLQWLQQHPGWFLILDNVIASDCTSCTGFQFSCLAVRRPSLLRVLAEQSFARILIQPMLPITTDRTDQARAA